MITIQISGNDLASMAENDFATLADRIATLAKICPMASEQGQSAGRANRTVFKPFNGDSSQAAETETPAEEKVLREKYLATFNERVRYGSPLVALLAKLGDNSTIADAIKLALAKGKTIRELSETYQGESVQGENASGGQIEKPRFLADDEEDEEES